MTNTKRELAEKIIKEHPDNGLCRCVAKKLPNMADEKVYGITRRLGYKWYENERRWGY